MKLRYILLVGIVLFIALKSFEICTISYWYLSGFIFGIFLLKIGIICWHIYKIYDMLKMTAIEKIEQTIRVQIHLRLPEFLHKPATWILRALVWWHLE